MTKEAIIKSALRYLVKMHIEEGSVGFAVDNDHDHDCCWDDVLTWLEAQSCKECEDYISREAVETFKEELIDKLAYTGYTEEYKNEIIDIINQMPSVYPKRPKGKWIITYPDGAKAFKCNQCNKYASIYHATNYCPNCGAYMKEDAE